MTIRFISIIFTLIIIYSILLLIDRPIQIDVNPQKYFFLSTASFHLLETINKNNYILNNEIDVLVLDTFQKTLPEHFILKKYGQKSKKINVRFIHPHQDMILAAKWNQPLGSIIIKKTHLSNSNQTVNQKQFNSTIILLPSDFSRQKTIGQEVVLESFAEELLIKSFYALTQKKTKTIYFTEGQGELSITNSNNNNLSLLSQKLLLEGIITKSFKVTEKALSFPEDSSLIVVAKPQSNISSHFTKLIDNTLKKQIPVLICLDPLEEYPIKQRKMAKKSLNQFDLYLQLFDIHIGYHTLIDKQRGFKKPYWFSVDINNSLNIFKDFSSFFIFGAQSIVGNTNSIKLIESGPQTRQIQKSLEDSQKLGRISIAQLKLQNENSGHLLVVGDSGWMANYVMRGLEQANVTKQIFLWLLNEKTKVYGTVRNKTKSVILLSQEKKWIINILLFSIPLLVLFFFFYKIYQRKNNSMKIKEIKR